MDYTEINRCIEILNKKPTWLIGKENIADKLQCFDTIQHKGTPSTIHSLVAFLRSDNVLIRSKAAETVLHLFSKLRSLNDYADAAKHLHIGKSDLDYYRIDFDETAYVQLLGIASLNNSGYVRQRAVEELARTKNAVGIKYILFRLGDWVPAVRKTATEAIANFLEYDYINELLTQFSVIDWLLKVERVDLSEIHDRIIEFIISQDFTEDFYRRLRQIDDKARLRFYKSFLASGHVTKEQIGRIKADNYFLVRAELLTHLSLFDIPTQKELITGFLHDKSTALRLRAMYASKSFSPEFNGQFDLLLSDEAASVRELSRYLLRDMRIDFADLYRQRIATTKFPSGSLLGLSETGNQEDLPTYELYIHSNNSKLAVASLIAINKFNPDAAKEYALNLLTHTSKRVRDKAADVLAKSNDIQTMEGIRLTYAQGNYEIRRTVLRLYNRIGGWNIIGDLLLALGDEHAAIQELAWEFLDKWKLKSTRLFTNPPKAEIDRANQIYSGLNLRRLKMTTARTDLLQELKFYLR